MTVRRKGLHSFTYLRGQLSSSKKGWAHTKWQRAPPRSQGNPPDVLNECAGALGSLEIVQCAWESEGSACMQVYGDAQVDMLFMKQTSVRRPGAGHSYRAG
eukprot:1153691-Pelagomonas_calceolata.AAC.3